MPRKKSNHFCFMLTKSQWNLWLVRPVILNFHPSVHPSVHPSILGKFMVGARLTPIPADIWRGQGLPRRSHQFITWPIHKKNHSCSHSQIQKIQSCQLTSPACFWTVGGRQSTRRQLKWSIYFKQKWQVAVMKSTVTVKEFTNKMSMSAVISMNVNLPRSQLVC